MDHSEVKHLPKIDHAPAKLDDASKMLMRAADLIDAYGHCQGKTVDDQGRHCIVGAMDYYQQSAAFCEAMERLHDALGKCPINWNNELGRTKEEVVAKMRSVALTYSSR